MDAGATTPRMGEVEPRLEQRSRATQEQLPGDLGGDEDKITPCTTPLIPTFSLKGEGARIFEDTFTLG